MRINKTKIKEFVLRRRMNLLTLIVITLMSIVVTTVCMMTGFSRERVEILELVTALLIVLCCIQSFRMHKSYRTMKDYKGKRKKRERNEE